MAHRKMIRHYLQSENERSKKESDICSERHRRWETFWFTTSLNTKWPLITLYHLTQGPILALSHTAILERLKDWSFSNDRHFYKNIEEYWVCSFMSVISFCVCLSIYLCVRVCACVEIKQLLPLMIASLKWTAGHPAAQWPLRSRSLTRP